MGQRQVAVAPGRTRGPDPLFHILSYLAIVGATVHVLASTREGAGGAFLVEAGCVVLLAQLRRVGAFSLGGATLLASSVAFLYKWYSHSSPNNLAIPYDNDRAIWVYGAFLCAFVVAWSIAGPMIGRPSRRVLMPTVNSRHLSTAAVVGLVTFIAVASGMRFWLAESYGIGVPGVVPTAPSGFGPLFGGLYYVSVYGPVGAALIVIGTAWVGEQARVVFVCAALVVYVYVGASIGSRSSAVFAGGAVFLGIVWSPGVARRFWIQLSWLGIAIGGVLLGVSAALQTRGSGFTDQGNALEFIIGRIGGLDYLSPVVAVLDNDTASIRFANPTVWNDFLKTAVYHLPGSATNGLASTLPGWALGVGGLAGVIVVGLIAGVLAGVADHSAVLRGKSIGAEVRWAGIMLAWAILLLEGSAVSAIYVVGIFALMGWFTTFLTEQGFSQQAAVESRGRPRHGAGRGRGSRVAQAPSP